MTNDNLTKLFVYGTLKKGGRWHHLLGDSTLLVINFVLQGYMMKSIKSSCPVIYSREDASVIGEVYEVTEEVLNAVRSIEQGYSEVHREGLTAFVGDSPSPLANAKEFFDFENVLINDNTKTKTFTWINKG